VVKYFDEIANGEDDSSTRSSSEKKVSSAETSPVKTAKKPLTKNNLAIPEFLRASFEVKKTAVLDR